MKKAFILAAALCSAAACSNNQAVTMNEDGKEIITDGFRVVSADESFPAEDLLGPLGDKKVVRGRKDPSHLAFVKNDNGHNYIIVNKILVTCPKNVNCIPADLQAKQLSRSVYEITVGSYEKWKSVQDELNRTQGIKQIAPAFEHGIIPSLKNSR